MLALGVAWLAATAPLAGQPVQRSGAAVPAASVREAARAALESRCAGCHEASRDPIVMESLVDVLDLDRLALDAAAVVPGRPYGSALYTAMVGAHPVPLGSSAPTSTEIAAVAAWIASLTPSTGCGDRPVISSAEAGRLIAEAQARSGAEAGTLRFLSLTHLWNACLPAREVTGLAQGAAKLMNSLSWSDSPGRLEALGPGGAILTVSLPTFGWTGAHWDLVAVRLTESARRLSKGMPEEVRTVAGAASPVLPADAFAAAIAEPAVYAELLGLPPRRDQLEPRLGVQIDADIRAGLARRAGLKRPQETRANRIVERHPATAGSFWVTYDAASEPGRQSVIETPLGPMAGPASGQGAAEISRAAFRHDASEVLHHLPNGFVAFSVFDARGQRLEALPAEMRPARWATKPVRAGLDCLACHARGPLPAPDDVRASVDADRRVSREVRDAVLALYPPRAELFALSDADTARMRAALLAAGVEPDLTIRGQEPVTALVQSWQRPVDLARGAAEFGVATAAFRDRIDRIIADLKPAARRWRQSAVSRAEADALFAAVTAQPEGPPGAPTPPLGTPLSATPAGPGDPLRLSVWSERETYTAGETATFYAAANKTCHLTLVSIDAQGKAIVLLPSDLDADNTLTPGRELQVPAVDAPYRLRVKAPGRETLVGICSTTRKTAPGVDPDYEQQRFTILGDWRAFDTAAHGVDGDPTKAKPAVDPRPAQSRRRPRPPAQPDAAAEQVARAAISYDVK